MPLPRPRGPVIFEVMVDDVDRAFWTRYRKELEQRFAQDTIVVRAHAIELLGDR